MHQKEDNAAERERLERELTQRLRALRFEYSYMRAQLKKEYAEKIKQAGG